MSRILDGSENCMLRRFRRFEKAVALCCFKGASKSGFWLSWFAAYMHWKEHFSGRCESVHFFGRCAGTVVTLWRTCSTDALRLKCC